LRLPLLIVQHEPNAKITSPYSAGLYHFAVLLPGRKSLASTYVKLKDSGVKYDGFADHLVSESLYLSDSENNGIEIYCDKSADQLPRNASGHIVMDTRPLNLNSLLSEVYGEGARNADAFLTGGRIGQMHLKVTTLERSIEFYHKKLGLDITLDWSSMGAAFLSSGGYHHHIGINTWHSLDGEGHRDDETGLKNFTIIMSDLSSFNTIKTNILDCSSSEEHIKQRTQNNQFLVSYPDGIQIVIRTE
jgi:catechol 2,3-dioxygenase